MDELNVHQFWGISPYLDLLAAADAAEPSTADITTPTAFLQVSTSSHSEYQERSV